ncbi:hypothetical protein [Bacillus sp. GB_SG_008]|uniref:hypothetical protein n=1 Tax=Bacillus sp. GB_SG_008 TaxID=3454627 RepID=UPI003F85FDD0
MKQKLIKKLAIVTGLALLIIGGFSSSALAAPYYMPEKSTFYSNPNGSNPVTFDPQTLDVNQQWFLIDADHNFTKKPVWIGFNESEFNNVRFDGKNLTIYSGKKLLADPNNPEPIGWIAPQTIVVSQEWFYVNTQSNSKWLGYNAPGAPVLDSNNKTSYPGQYAVYQLVSGPPIGGQFKEINRFSSPTDAIDYARNFDNVKVVDTSLDPYNPKALVWDDIFRYIVYQLQGVRKDQPIRIGGFIDQNQAKDKAKQYQDTVVIDIRTNSTIYKASNIDEHFVQIDTVQGYVVWKDSNKNILKFTSKMAIDTDGDGKVRYESRYKEDYYHQPDISLGIHVDPGEYPYFVLPGNKYTQWGAHLGDYAAVINHNANDTTAYAIFADVGPFDKLGEGSLGLGIDLKIPNVSPNNGASGNIEFIIFLNSSNGRPIDSNVVRQIAKAKYDQYKN